MLRSRVVKRHLASTIQTLEVLKFAVRRWTHSLSPSSAIQRDLAIDCDRNESIGLDILELNNLIPSSRTAQLFGCELRWGSGSTRRPGC
jgi:hypothetical protein